MTFPRPVKLRLLALCWHGPRLNSLRAQIATSTLADFERGERTPLAANAEAIAAALRRRGITFMGGGAVTGPANVAKIIAPKHVASAGVLRWINAQNLVEWAGRRDGPAGLPELLSRLILVSCGPVALRFPADDSIAHPGWDGIVESSADTPYVPRGWSAWEFLASQSLTYSTADASLAGQRRVMLTAGYARGGPRSAVRFGLGQYVGDGSVRALGSYSLRF